MQEARLGLLDAVSRYDPARGTRFSTYAYARVRNAVQRAVWREGFTVKPPSTGWRVGQAPAEVCGLDAVADPVAEDRPDILIDLEHAARALTAKQVEALALVAVGFDTREIAQAGGVLTAGR